MGAVMLGSRLEYIMRLACREISQQHCDDFIIIWGGANDINRNESNTVPGNSHSETNTQMSLQ
jgi:hypothetical protein